MKAEVLPVYKKAKLGLIVNQRGPGANTSDVTVSTAYTKFADMEPPATGMAIGRNNAVALCRIAPYQRQRSAVLTEAAGARGMKK